MSATCLSAPASANVSTWCGAFDVGSLVVDLALTPFGGHLVSEDVHHGKTASGVHS